MADVSKYSDTLDSRDIDERIEELESEREDLETARDDAKEALDNAREALEEAEEGDDEEAQALARVNADDALAEWEKACQELEEWEQTSEGEELKELKEFKEEAEGYCDWAHGETLIHESYFQQYAQQLAEDIGAIPSDARWPCTCIDWEQAANELKQDYSSADFGGETFYYRG